jgi:hypothetical protein
MQQTRYGSRLLQSNYLMAETVFQHKGSTRISSPIVYLWQFERPFDAISNHASMRCIVNAIGSHYHIKWSSKDKASPYAADSIWKPTTPEQLFDGGDSIPAQGLNPHLISPFDMIVAADCVYDTAHAGMIRDRQEMLHGKHLNSCWRNKPRDSPARHLVALCYRYCLPHMPKRLSASPMRSHLSMLCRLGKGEPLGDRLPSPIARKVSTTAESLRP